MRCVHCNTPLLVNARFCTACGAPVAATMKETHKDEAAGASQEDDGEAPSAMGQAKEGQEDVLPTDQTQRIVYPDVSVRPRSSTRSPITITAYTIPTVQAQVAQRSLDAPRIIPPAQQRLPHNADPQVPEAHPIQDTPPLLFVSPTTPPPPLPYFRLDTSKKVINMLPAVINPQTHPAPRRRRGGCGCLFTLFVLVLVIGGGWFFVFRPYLHNLAESELNQSMTAAVNQIPAGASALPTNSLSISETVINNLIVLNTSPSSPVQSPATHITTSNIRLDFQLYGQPCSVALVPKAQNGQISATNVTESGIIGLVLSPDDVASIMNRHLADAQTRINRQVKDVQLKDHEVDLTLG